MTPTTLNTMAKADPWPTTDLERIVAQDDLKIAPFREDGVTTGTPTWIWCVAVDGDLFVRAYSGRSSRWYQAALRQRAGRIIAGGQTHDCDSSRWKAPSTPALTTPIVPSTAAVGTSRRWSAAARGRPRSGSIPQHGREPRSEGRRSARPGGHSLRGVRRSADPGTHRRDHSCRSHVRLRLGPVAVSRPSTDPDLASPWCLTGQRPTEELAL